MLLKSNISYPVIPTGVRNVSFQEHFDYALNEGSPKL